MRVETNQATKISEGLLESLVRTIREEVSPESIWLFGSYAYGVPDETSDLDLFVLFDSKKNTRFFDEGNDGAYGVLRTTPRKMRYLLQKVCFERVREYGMELDIVVSDIDEVERTIGCGFVADDVFERGCLLRARDHGELQRFLERNGVERANNKPRHVRYDMPHDPSRFSYEQSICSSPLPRTIPKFPPPRRALPPRF